VSEPLRPLAIVLTPRTPWPLDDGGRIGLWQTVWSAAQAFDTVLVTLFDPRIPSAPVPEEIERLAIRVLRIPHRPPPLPLAAWRGVTGIWPFTLERYRSERMQREVLALARSRERAFVFVNHLHLVPAVHGLSAVPWVLREHNVEFSWMERLAAGYGQGPHGLYASYQAGRLRRAEARACREAAVVLAVQPNEAKLLRSIAPAARIEHLPIGLDPSRYPDPRPETPPIVLIAGTYDWAPNVEGALRFLREGWGRLAARVPGLRLRVAGKNPPAILEETARAAGAEHVGYVESMPREFSQASLLLVPLWVGAGARVKIVEALMARLPVVSTRLGAEGLGLEPGTHFAVGESSAELADAAAELLENADRRVGMIARGRRHALERFSLEAVARLQNNWCSEAVASHVGRRTSLRPLH